MVYNRPVSIPRQSENVASFTFSEICEASLGPADYISIASTYSTIFISDVPPIKTSMKNEARRLINLLDALVCPFLTNSSAKPLIPPFRSSQYESRTTLHVHSSTSLHGLFFPDSSDTPNERIGDSLEEEALSEMQKEMEEPTRPNISLYPQIQTVVDQPIIIKVKESERVGGAGAFSNLAIFTGEDERFAFVCLFLFPFLLFVRWFHKV